MRKFMATLGLMATLSLGILAVAAEPVMAEEDLGQVRYGTANGFYNYQVVEYPSRDNAFMFFPNSYVEFDIKGGTAWMLETSRINFNVRSESGLNNGIICNKRPKGVENFNVSFFAPDGTKLSEQKNVRINFPFTIPNDGKKYDHLVMRVENYTHQNLDARVLIWSPVEPVMAKPIVEE